jgi:hypothetical protein
LRLLAPLVLRAEDSPPSPLYSIPMGIGKSGDGRDFVEPVHMRVALQHRRVHDHAFASRCAHSPSVADPPAPLGLVSRRCFPWSCWTVVPPLSWHTYVHMCVRWGLPIPSPVGLVIAHHLCHMHRVPSRHELHYTLSADHWRSGRSVSCLTLALPFMSCGHGVWRSPLLPRGQSASRRGPGHRLQRRRLRPCPTHCRY